MRTIQIPGGEAVLFDKAAELKPRRRREIEVVSGLLGRQLEDIVKAKRLLVDGQLIDERADKLDADGKPVFVGEVDMTEKQMRLLMRLNDVTAWALLASWTLPQPVPATPDDYLDDCPADVFDRLREEAAVINAELSSEGDPFTPDALPDEPGDEPDTSAPTSA